MPSPSSSSAKALLTFSDDFDTFSSWNGVSGTWDTSRWYAPNGTHGDHGEVEWYVNPNYAPTSAADPYSVSNGDLDITAAPAPASLRPLINNESYTSGFITTYHSFAQTYGYFEIRAELPAGKGLWPAFWLLPADNSWPPELDAMEVLGDKPDVLYTTVHSQIEGTQHLGAGQYQTQGRTTVADTTAGYHTYGVDWEKDVITWYFDGKAVFSAPTPPDMHTPMYLIANLAVGGDWPGQPDAATKFPATYKIDYIHAYSALPDLTPLVVGADEASASVSWAYGHDSAVSFSGSHLVAASVALTGTVTMLTAPAQTEDFSGPLSDGTSAGRLVKAGQGTLVLDGDGAYSGGTELSGGTLRLGAAASAGAGAIDFAPGAQATLVLAGAAARIANRIAGFASGDSIDLAGIGLASFAAYDAATGLVDVKGADGSVLAALDIDGASQEVFAATSDGRGGSVVTADAPVKTPSVVLDTLVVRVSGDSFKGDPSFSVSVDGKPAGTFATAASHADGAWQDVVIQGAFGARAGQVAVRFLNDLYGGSAAMDRNLYVEQVTYDGRVSSGATALNTAGPDTAGGADLFWNGTATFSVAPRTTVYNLGGPDTLTLSVSEDAYLGDARFTVSIDGVQQGGVFTATASHAAGQSQDVTLSGAFGAGPHAVSVNFVNDAYGGSAAADRNLYVGSIAFDGQSAQEGVAQDAGGAHVYAGIGSEVTEVPASTAALTTTGDDVVDAGSGTELIRLDGPGAVVNGGSGIDTIASSGGADLIRANAAAIAASGGSGLMTFIGGSAHAAIAAGPGGLDFTAGSGSAAISAGTGADLFTFVQGSAGGRIEIDGFKVGADHLALQGYAPGTPDAAILSAMSSGGSSTLVLPDGTSVVLGGVAAPTARLFA